MLHKCKSYCISYASRKECRGCHRNLISQGSHDRYRWVRVLTDTCHISNEAPVTRNFWDHCQTMSNIINMTFNRFHAMFQAEGADSSSRCDYSGAHTHTPRVKWRPQLNELQRTPLKACSLWRPFCGRPKLIPTWNRFHRSESSEQIIKIHLKAVCMLDALLSRFSMA